MRKITSALDDIFIHLLADDSSALLERPEVEEPQVSTTTPSEGFAPPPGFRHGTDEDRKKYGIPPGLTNVHVAEDPDSHILARGYDAKGRQKSIYSSDFEKQQAAKKFNRVKALHEKIPQLDQALEQDSPHNDDAAALLLSRHMGLRPGSTRDTKADVQAYGASTLRAKHVKVNGDRANFDFIGKEGKRLRFSTTHPHIVNSLQSRLEGKRPNDPLFNTTDTRMNNYLKKTVGPLNEEGDMPLVKDLRTYHANSTALDEVSKIKRPPKTRTEFQKRRRAVADVVSKKLGNTPAMALNSYINPSVFEPWLTDPSWIEPRTRAPKESALDTDDSDNKEFIEHIDPQRARSLIDEWLKLVNWYPIIEKMDAAIDDSDEDSQ